METPSVDSKALSENVATDEELIECEGKRCDGCLFKKSEKGCNPIARLCPICSKELCQSFAGEHYILNNFYVKTILRWYC